MNNLNFSIGFQKLKIYILNEVFKFGVFYAFKLVLEHVKVYQHQFKCIKHIKFKHFVESVVLSNVSKHVEIVIQRHSPDSRI